MDIGNAQRRALGFAGDPVWIQLGMTEAQFVAAKKQHAEEYARRTAGQEYAAAPVWVIERPIGKVFVDALRTSDKAEALRVFAANKHLGWRCAWLPHAKLPGQQLSKGQQRKLRKRHRSNSNRLN